MANILRGGLTRDDPSKVGGQPSGPVERFHLGRSNRVVQMKNKPYSVPVIINGFTEYADMGAYNEMPKEYVDVLEQAASTAVEVPNADPRTAQTRAYGDRIPDSTMTVEYLGDFEMIRDHKNVQDVRHREVLTVPGGIQRRKPNKGPKKYVPPPDAEAYHASTQSTDSAQVSGEAQKED